MPEALAIYVYGSFARGDEWPSSDLDLAVLLPAGHRLQNRFDLANQISTVVGREVDLVDLRRANLDLIREVLRDGRALHVTSESAVLEWEAKQMTTYSEFNAWRADLLAMYLSEPPTGRT